MEVSSSLTFQIITFTTQTVRQMDRRTDGGCPIPTLLCDGTQILKTAWTMIYFLCGCVSAPVIIKQTEEEEEEIHSC